MSGVFARSELTLILPHNPPARWLRLLNEGMEHEMGECVRQVIVFFHAEMYQLLDTLLRAFPKEEHFARLDVMRSKDDTAPFIMAPRPHGFHVKSVRFQLMRQRFLIPYVLNDPHSNVTYRCIEKVSHL